ncbi:MAG: PA14 domain-containing protein, partial [Planctomycetota bacterium]
MRALHLLALVLWTAPQVHAQIADRETDPGLTLRTYQVEGHIDRIPALVPDQTPNRDTKIETSNVPGPLFGELPAPIVSHLEGWIIVPEDVNVQFRLTSDDGSRLSLDGKVWITHDGPHGATSKDGAFEALSAGAHELFVEHFDSGGARSLRLEWRA